MRERGRKRWESENMERKGEGREGVSLALRARRGGAYRYQTHKTARAK